MITEVLSYPEDSPPSYPTAFTFSTPYSSVFPVLSLGGGRGRRKDGEGVGGREERRDGGMGVGREGESHLGLSIEQSTILSMLTSWGFCTYLCPL